MSTFHETAQRTAGHIRQPFTLQEIADQIETGEYNAELMLQHLMLCTDSLQRENAALRSLLREAITDHVSPYDLPETENYIARVKAALGGHE